MLSIVSSHLFYCHPNLERNYSMFVLKINDIPLYKYVAIYHGINKYSSKSSSMYHCKLREVYYLYSVDCYKKLRYFV